MKVYKNNKEIKRELRPVRICAVLFLCVAVFAIIYYWVEGKNDKTNASREEGVLGKYNKEATEREKGADQVSKLLVVIDPGHGGNDPGKVGIDGVLEKDINLEISIALETELEERGVEALLLRTDDVNLATEGATNKKTSDMKNRVAMINESNPDILVSIHQNSYTDPEVRGPQVFYHGSSEESERLAIAMQEKLKDINPQYARAAKEGNDYYILNKTICPGVIVECGFLSCPAESALLTEKGYQQKIASAIVDAIEEIYKKGNAL